MGKPFKDLTGQRFNAWTITEQHQSVARPDGHGRRTQWFCICQCGSTRWVDATNLTGEISTSCGCVKAEIARQSIKQARESVPSGKPALKHGYSKGSNRKQERLYTIWAAMKRRCDNPNEIGYKYYGAKGITYSAEWKDFIPFQRWAFATGYNDTLTIERNNVQANYTPENCKWIPRSQQPWNTSKSVKLSSGESLVAFCNRTGVPYDLVWHALKFYREYPDQWAEVFS